MYERDDSIVLTILYRVLHTKHHFVFNSLNIMFNVLESSFLQNSNVDVLLLLHAYFY